MNRRTLLIFIANLPWTIVGLAAACLSGPKEVHWNRNPPALVFVVASFWWYNWLPGKKGVRASTNGHVVRLGPLELERDLEHELIHVEQYLREPFIHPFLYAWESYKHGYRDNRYEREAYDRSGSIYSPPGM